jgi:hypothetical protein
LESYKIGAVETSWGTRNQKLGVRVGYVKPSANDTNIKVIWELFTRHVSKKLASKQLPAALSKKGNDRPQDTTIFRI